MRMLIVDSDPDLLEELTTLFEANHHTATISSTVPDAVRALGQHEFDVMFTDIRMGRLSGIDLLVEAQKRWPRMIVVVLTGKGTIQSAIDAMRAGAFDYLAKPADADEIYGALLATRNDKAEVPENPMSADRVRWEHIQRIYELCGRNVSETARRLNMHRRTLQRILAKRAPR